MASLLEHTVMPSGGDFTSLDAAIDHLIAAHANLVTADVYAEVKIDGDWTGVSDTAAVTINGLTTDATRYLLACTTAAARHAGVWSNSKYNLTVTDGWSLVVDDDHVRVDGLQVAGPGITGSRQVVTLGNFGIAVGGDVRFFNCLVKGDDDETSSQIGIYVGSNSGTIYIWNTVVYAIGAISGSRGIATNGVVNIYSSTVHAKGAFAILENTGTLTTKNCYAGGSSVGDYSGATMTSCASSDTTGSVGLQSIAVGTDTFVNVTAGTEDFHLAADGLSPLQGAGVDTTGDAAPMNFTTDIDGDTRDATWDIGADAWVVAGGAVWIPKVIFIG